MEDIQCEPEIDNEKEEEEAVDVLTAHFRRTRRGRIVELPRWAQ
jgi:hypothetical protein